MWYQNGVPDDAVEPSQFMKKTCPTSDRDLPNSVVEGDYISHMSTRSAAMVDLVLADPSYNVGYQ